MVLPMRMRLFFLLPVFLLATLGAAAGLSAGASAAGPAERKLTIFYTAEVHGTPEPCGCTSDPLGDVARYAALVRAATRGGSVLLVDGGGLSFPESSTAKEQQANSARAAFLGEALGRIG